MKKVTIEQARQFGVILLVVLVGLSGFNLTFSYIYREALQVSDCDLCFELNPDLKYCIESWVSPELNFSEINFTLVDYERKN